MSSELSAPPITLPASLATDSVRAGERFLADASARLAESLDVLATIRTLSELAVESFADGCRITLLDGGAQARGEYPFVPVALTSRSPEYAAVAQEVQERFPLPPDAAYSFAYVI